MNKKEIILSTSYFPNIFYISQILSHSDVTIEIYDHYCKQSFRNRCAIYSPNGIQVLSIPVEKNHFQKTLVKNIKISYNEKWQKNHFRSIEAAYRSAPYYEYYIDDFFDCFSKKFLFLIDLNNYILEKVIDIFESETKIQNTNAFIEPTNNTNDLRLVIHPKTLNNLQKYGFTCQPYHQVFSSKFGYIENLCILDLLFNEGPNSFDIIKSGFSENKILI